MRGDQTVPLSDAVKEIRSTLVASLNDNITGQHSATLVTPTPLAQTSVLELKLDVDSVRCEDIDHVRYVLLCICAKEPSIRAAHGKALPRLDQAIDAVKGVKSLSDSDVIDSIIQELRHKGRYDHNFEYDGYGTSFLKTSVRVIL
jgi:hypothetical protein